MWPFKEKAKNGSEYYHGQCAYCGKVGRVHNIGALSFGGSPRCDDCELASDIAIQELCSNPNRWIKKPTKEQLKERKRVERIIKESKEK